MVRTDADQRGASMRILLTAFAVAALGISVGAQQAAPVPPPTTARAAAPFDLAGQWVSVVTEDWRWRMLVPRKGDYSSIPLTPEGRKVADGWDPSKMSSDGCRPYGAPAVMRVPGRLRIDWENDTTLRIQAEAGAQTRRLHFAGTPAPAERTWQGHSTAQWDLIEQLGGVGVSLQTGRPRTGALKVVTTSLRAGYLRANGVPYSENAALTEYFDRLTDEGTEWLTVLTIVRDPQYLTQPFVTSTHYKREPAGAPWKPSPCEVESRESR